MRLLEHDRGARVYLWLAVGAGLLAAAAVVGQALLLSRTISQVFLQHRTLADVEPLLLAILALAVGRAGLVWGGEVAAQRLAGRVKQALRDRLVGHLLALGPAFTRGERGGELVNTVTEGVEALDDYLAGYLPQQYLAALVPVLVLVFAFPRDALSSAILLFTAPLIPLFMVLIGGAAKEATARRWSALGQMSAHFLEVLQGIPTLKRFGRSREQARSIARITARFGETTMQVLRVAFLSSLVLEMAATLSTAVIAVEIGLRLLYGRLAFEPALTLLILAPEFYLPLRALGAKHHARMAGSEAAARLFALLDTRMPGASQDGQDKGGQDGKGLDEGVRVVSSRPFPSCPSLSCPPLSCPSCEVPASEPALRFERVSYAYDGGERPALKGVSLEIPRGQTVALVGPSGAGKTTVAQLLLRFLEPDEGRITWGWNTPLAATTAARGGPDPSRWNTPLAATTAARGRGRAARGRPPGYPTSSMPLAAMEPAAWRARIAWVPQHPHLFHATVAENLRLARPDAGEEDLIRAARAAHAHDFIAALPRGYETPIGEHGARLSGGQRQRLALARAFLKEAPFVLLDEPTAHLDPENGALLRDAIARLARGRTVLLITHDLASAAGADAVVVLEGGRVVDSGRPGDLRARTGLYERLAAAAGRAP